MLCICRVGMMSSVISSNWRVIELNKYCFQLDLKIAIDKKHTKLVKKKDERFHQDNTKPLENQMLDSNKYCS